MRALSIAIDGPAGAGKSSVSKLVAKKLGYAYLDTGAMYRAVTYEALERNLGQEEDIVRMASSLHMEVVAKDDGMHVMVDGADVTDFLRLPDVSARVSVISSYSGVRETMVKIQREQAEKGGIVLDGRDIGTVVIPNADVKIFLTASVHTRALRRFKEMKEKFSTLTLEDVERDIEKRDHADETRIISPLKKAEDAILLDNSMMTLEETADAIIAICMEKM